MLKQYPLSLLLISFGFLDNRPLVFPSGHSYAATRIKGRGFLLPPPARHSVEVQTSETPQSQDACPFQQFLAGSSAVLVNGELLWLWSGIRSSWTVLETRAFWFDMAHRIFQESPSTQASDIPSDSVESYDFMRRLDYPTGIPAHQFLHLFAVCARCGKVMTRYWAEDHLEVCSAAPAS